jgi:hypothetical protein
MSDQSYGQDSTVSSKSPSMDKSVSLKLGDYIMYIRVRFTSDNNILTTEGGNAMAAIKCITLPHIHQEWS